MARFIRAIDPRATVSHDVKIPDVDTKNPRQRDVWVEARIGGLLPVKILVSCKQLSRRVNEQDIDALFGEIRSANAHMGAIFANGGFTSPALKKAAAMGISCCRLYASEPAELPNVLPMQIFLCVPTVLCQWVTRPTSEWSIATFRDLLNLELEYGGKMIPLSQFFTASIRHFHVESMKRESDRYAFPRDISRTLAINDDDGRTPFSITLNLRWRIFRVSANAALLDGAYSYTDDTFIGEQNTSWLPLHDPAAAAVWDELPTRPDTRGTCGITYFRPLPDVVQSLRDRFGDDEVESMASEFGA